VENLYFIPQINQIAQGLAERKKFIALCMYLLLEKSLHNAGFLPYLTFSVHLDVSRETR
jgi:hypothetical protein